MLLHGFKLIFLLISNFKSIKESIVDSRAIIFKTLKDSTFRLSIKKKLNYRIYLSNCFLNDENNFKSNNFCFVISKLQTV